MSETFRLRKAVKYQGMAFSTIFFVVLLGYFSLFLLDEPAKHGFKGEHDGQILMQDRKLLTIDKDEVLANVRAGMQRLTQKSGVRIQMYDQ
jgi:hypothetical protein